MAQIDLGKIKLTDEELSEKIIQTNGGVRLGKDADGKPGYVVTDAEMGADTVVPFSSSIGNAIALPIESEIFLDGTWLSFSNGRVGTIYLTNLFKEKIPISNIKEIKFITNLTRWYWLDRGNIGTASQWIRRLYPYLLVEKEEDKNRINYDAVINMSGFADISILDREDILPLQKISSYNYLIGYGGYFWATGPQTGSTSSLWGNALFCSSYMPNNYIFENKIGIKVT